MTLIQAEIYLDALMIKLAPRRIKTNSIPNLNGKEPLQIQKMALKGDCDLLGPSDHPSGLSMAANMSTCYPIRDEKEYKWIRSA